MWAFPKGYSGRGMKVSIHLHLVPMLRMSGAIISFPTHLHGVHYENIYSHAKSSCVCSASYLSPNFHVYVVSYIKAWRHHIIVNLCGRKLKLRVKRLLFLACGLNVFSGETKANRDGKYVRLEVQRLQGVALLYFSRYTCHGMQLVHFDNVRKHINLREQTL